MNHDNYDNDDDDDENHNEIENDTEADDDDEENDDQQDGEEDVPAMTREEFLKKQAEDEVAFDRYQLETAKENNGVVPTWMTPEYSEQSRLVPLDATQPKAAKADTEELLNGLIEDCRFLIHELVYHSARLTPDPGSRLKFIGSARGLAITAGAIGKTIARLRNGEPAAAPQEKRVRLIHEHVHTTPSLPPGDSP